MTSNPATTDWLMSHYEYMNRVRQRVTRYYRPGEWTGPRTIRPIVQLLSVMDAGQPMTVTSADYADPQRWWL